MALCMSQFKSTMFNHKLPDKFIENHSLSYVWKTICNDNCPMNTAGFIRDKITMRDFQRWLRNDL